MLFTIYLTTILRRKYLNVFLLFAAAFYLILAYEIKNAVPVITGIVCILSYFGNKTDTNKKGILPKESLDENYLIFIIGPPILVPIIKYFEIYQGSSLLCFVLILTVLNSYNYVNRQYRMQTVYETFIVLSLLSYYGLNRNLNMIILLSLSLVVLLYALFEIFKEELK